MQLSKGAKARFRPAVKTLSRSHDKAIRFPLQATSYIDLTHEFEWAAFSQRNSDWLTLGVTSSRVRFGHHFASNTRALKVNYVQPAVRYVGLWCRQPHLITHDR